MRFSVGTFLLVTIAIAVLFIGCAYFLWTSGASLARYDEHMALRMNGDLDEALIYNDMISST